MTNAARLAIVAGKYWVGVCAVRSQRNRGALLPEHDRLEPNLRTNMGAGDVTRCHVADIVDLAVNDYVKLRAFQSSGAALNVGAAMLAFVRVG